MLKLDDESIDLEVVKLHLDRLWHEVFWRRENEQKVMLWTFGLVGVLVSFIYGSQRSLEPSHRCVLMVLLGLVGAAAIFYLYQNFRKVKALARVIVRINQKLGAWQKNEGEESLYEETWERWGRADKVLRLEKPDLVTGGYIVITLLVTILGIVAICIYEAAP